MGSATFTSSTTWTCPAGVLRITVECWGPGGNGGNSPSGGYHPGGGGGGNAYAKLNSLTVIPGSGYTVTIGTPGSSPTTFDICSADYGRNGGDGTPSADGTGGSAGLAVNSSGDVRLDGNDGTDGVLGGSPSGGNGGGGASGGSGGFGATGDQLPDPGTAPGGGGGGAWGDGFEFNTTGGAGAAGQVTLSWLDPITGSGSSAIHVSSTGAAFEGVTATGAATVLVGSTGAGSEKISAGGAAAVRVGTSGVATSYVATGGCTALVGGTGASTLIIPAAGTSTVLVASNGFTPLLQFNKYLNLLISEYRSSTNIQAWLRTNLTPFQEVLACLQSFASSFDLDSAVGAQLDILGTVVGTSRLVRFQPTGGASPILDDATFRVLIRSVIAQNHWDGTIDGLLRAWQQIFPGGILIVNDHQNMTVDLYVAAPLTSILQDLILNGYIIPRPEGVLYTISIATLPMLGFDRNDTYVAGFDTGHFT